MFRVVLSWPSVASAEAFTDRIDATCLKVATRTLGKSGGEFLGTSIPLERLALFLTRNKDARSQIDDMCRRRDRLRYAGAAGEGFSFFFDAAKNADCTCKEQGALERAHVANVKNQTDLKRRRDPAKIIGLWADNMYKENFTDRRTCLWVVGGPGTGKSSLLKFISGMWPEHFVFVPKFETLCRSVR